mmetsp:Transcript_30584/g.72843  ORF Transcript_30584/g.72843 Transcript_30584/m.72843 type:complete len:135 (-) Transcript_30584:31-435(-)
MEVSASVTTCLAITRALAAALRTSFRFIALVLHFARDGKLPCKPEMLRLGHMGRGSTCADPEGFDCGSSGSSSLTRERLRFQHHEELHHVLGSCLISFCTSLLRQLKSFGTMSSAFGGQSWRYYLCHRGQCRRR